MKLIKSRFLASPYILIACMSAIMAPMHVQAETKYVSDHLVITVRTGQGTEFQIIKTLGSGEHVEVLETTENGYTHIETSDGTEGWVRSQYLKSEPTAKEQLINVTAQLKKANSELNKIKKSYSSLKKEHQTLSLSQKALSTSNTKLKSEFSRISEISKKPIMLERLNKKLQQNNVSLEKDLQRLNQENHSLNDRSQREWFIVGALVLFGGIILGLILPKLRSKKSRSW